MNVKTDHHGNGAELYLNGFETADDCLRDLIHMGLACKSSSDPVVFRHKDGSELHIDRLHGKGICAMALNRSGHVTLIR